MTAVLVTGVGGGVGQSILKSLQDTPLQALGADAEYLATGLYAAAKSFLIPYASAPNYIPRILDICKEEGCALVFPGLDAELPVLARQRHIMRDAGVLPIVSTLDVVEICDDKLATSRFLAERGFPSVKTLPLPADVSSLGFPLVLKPRKGGARSAGVFRVANQQELGWRISNLNVANYVAQEYIEGDEYTCGSLTFDGSCLGVIVMRRILRDGDTYKAFVVRDERIEAHVRHVAEALKPFGPCNFQLRVRGNAAYIFEINARCSGTTYCRTLAGFNEPAMTANFLLHGIRPAYEIREFTIMRYWKELVVDNLAVSQIQTQNILCNARGRL